MAKNKKSAFAGKTSKNSKKNMDNKSNFGYLNLPKGIEIHTPKPGAVEELDILPYTVTDKNHPDKDGEIAGKGTLWYKRPFKVHKNVGPENDTVVCLKSIGEKCPICDHYEAEKAAGVDWEDIKNYKPSHRNLYAIITAKDRKSETIKVWDMSAFLFQDLLDEEISEDTDNEIFPDLEEGKTLKIRWKKDTYNGNAFATARKIDFKDRKKPYKESILNEVPDLDKLFKVLSYEDLKEKFFGSVEEGEKKKKDKKKDKKKKDKKKDKKKKDKKTDLNWSDLKDMELSELIEVAESNAIDPDDYIQEDEGDELNALTLSNQIAKALDIKIPKKDKQKPKCPKKKGEFGKSFGELKYCERCELRKECEKDDELPF